MQQRQPPPRLAGRPLRLAAPLPPPVRVPERLGLGFGVWDLGLEVWGLGFKGVGLRVGVSGLVFGFKGVGFRV